jgi:Ser/Thr protein kinase RdoA (MazF antagonist)
VNFDKTITFAIVKAETAVAHDAIRAVWDAYHAVTILGTADADALTDAIERATSCLPMELRTTAMPPARPYRETIQKDEFDDILG